MSKLCFCEYIDDHGEVNHILACCCNCQDLDEGFEGLITGRGVSTENKQGVISTVKDRMRIPWIGGARQISPDVSLPILILLSLTFLANFNLTCTILSFIFMFVINLFVYKRYLETLPKYFFVWTIISVIGVYVIFQAIVISFLLILTEENIACSLFLLFGVIFIYRLKVNVNASREIIQVTRSTDKLQFCTLCQIYIPKGTTHKYWIDACVTPSNVKLYTSALIFGLAAALYSADMTLTSVCRPYTVMSILLPEDCGEVYFMIESTLSFLSAVYSIILAVFLLWELVIVLKNYLCDGERESKI